MDKMRELLEVAKCPNDECEDGVVPHCSGVDDDGQCILEPQQCQWCAERQAALASKQEAEPVLHATFVDGAVMAIYTTESAKVLAEKAGVETVPLYTAPSIAPQAAQVPEGLCAEVLAFAKLMQFKINKNRHKAGPGGQRDQEGLRKGWRDCDTQFLIGKLHEEVGELLVEIEAGNADAADLEAADVGNIAMMLADQLRPLAAVPEQSEAEAGNG